MEGLEDLTNIPELTRTLYGQSHAPPLVPDKGIFFPCGESRACLHWPLVFLNSSVVFSALIAFNAYAVARSRTIRSSSNCCCTTATLVNDLVRSDSYRTEQPAERATLDRVRAILGINLHHLNKLRAGT